jgi:hypothetical protein
VHHQVVQQAQPVGIAGLHRGEGGKLVAQQIQRDARVLQRIVARVREQLVALDQPVVGVARKRQDRPLERVDDGQAQAGQVGELPLQLRHIVPAQVVPDQDARAGRDGIELPDHLGPAEPADAKVQAGRRVGANRADPEDALVAGRVDFEVDRERGPGGRCGAGGQGACHSNSPPRPRLALRDLRDLRDRRGRRGRGRARGLR